MSRLTRLLTITAAVTILFGCSAGKKQQSNRFENSSIALDKQECYGTCPVYTIEITGNGKVTYEGKKNVDKLGKFEKQLKPEEVNKLFNAFDCANFFDFRSEYDDPMVQDVPTTYLTFQHRGFKKKITDRFNAPEELKGLEKLVEEIAKTEEGWKKIE